jgi:hypothetical protein
VTPLVVPVSVKVPLAVVPPLKQGLEVVNVKLLTVTPVLLVDISDVVKLKACVPSGLVSDAVQLPLIALLLLLLPVLVPQPNRIKAEAKTNARAEGFK